MAIVGRSTLAAAQLRLKTWWICHFAHFATCCLDSAEKLRKKELKLTYLWKCFAMTKARLLHPTICKPSWQKSLRPNKDRRKSIESIGCTKQTMRSLRLSSRSVTRRETWFKTFIMKMRDTAALVILQNVNMSWPKHAKGMRSSQGQWQNHDAVLRQGTPTVFPISEPAKRKVLRIGP